MARHRPERICACPYRKSDLSRKPAPSQGCAVHANASNEFTSANVAAKEAINVRNCVKNVIGGPLVLRGGMNDQLAVTPKPRAF